MDKENRELGMTGYFHVLDSNGQEEGVQNIHDFHIESLFYIEEMGI